ncbi:glycoside hydrolase family 3 N-terminal domain-containing protein [uncultured Amnibacterium sp.]|uniref:glycoside hydrolase family 3 N-terminal domain-containing protein n=1 Tax=uncultured Amnibacterium sp. TaxID=1631851 RepID=UPI0035C9F995
MPASASASASAPAPTPVDRAQVAATALVDAMSTRQVAGQLVMTAATVAQFRSLRPLVVRYHLGGVMVRGRSDAGTKAVGSAVAAVQAAAPAHLPLLVATDQEGGEVQVLRGPGFPAIPSAVAQSTRSPARLRHDAHRWGAALRKAGVTVDLAPVADVPCAAHAAHNPPVGDLHRNYGRSIDGAARSVAAVVRGLGDAGVATSVKHFPGLGCVGANTDTTTRVVDTTTTARSTSLRPFRSGMAAGSRMVMVSSAVYERLDPGRPALFSHRIVTGLLRQRLGFTGVVISDDVGGAAAVRTVPVGQRATRFVAAGGDLLLDIVPADVPTIVAALTKKANSDQGFARLERAAAIRVVAERLRLANHLR